MLKQLKWIGNCNQPITLFILRLQLQIKYGFKEMFSKLFHVNISLSISIRFAKLNVKYIKINLQLKLTINFIF